MITIHSDDFGYKTYSDKKIIQLLRRDRIKSVSVLINMCDKNSLKSLVNLIRNKPDIRCGLHLNLTEGKSLESKEYIPTIITGRNNLLSLPKVMFGIFSRFINPGHIEREIKAQARALKKSGLKVSFIDSHQHLHAISPIAEIVEKIAKAEDIKVIRSYKSIKTYTLIAKIKYLILKSAAYLSYLIYFGKWGLPVSWNGDYSHIYSFMSWEGSHFDIASIKDKRLIFVTHPFLPFDSNKSYTWYLI